MRIPPVLVTPVNAVEADYTSPAVNIENARKVTLIAAGSSLYNRTAEVSTEVSLDGTTFVDFNMLVNNLENSNSQTTTLTESLTVPVNDSILGCFADLGWAFKDMRIVVDISDSGGSPSGTISCSVLVEY